MPSVCELKAMCKAKGIRGCSNKPKKELERMLSEHGSAPAPKKTPDDSVEKAAAIAKLAKIRATLKARKAEKKVPKATPTPVKVEEKARKPTATEIKTLGILIRNTHYYHKLRIGKHEISNVSGRSGKVKFSVQRLNEDMSFDPDMMKKLGSLVDRHLIYYHVVSREIYCIITIFIHKDGKTLTFSADPVESRKGLYADETTTLQEQSEIEYSDFGKYCAGDPEMVVKHSIYDTDHKTLQEVGSKFKEL